MLLNPLILSGVVRAFDVVVQLNRLESAESFTGLGDAIFRRGKFLGDRVQCLLRFGKPFGLGEKMVNLESPANALFLLKARVIAVILVVREQLANDLGAQFPRQVVGAPANADIRAVRQSVLRRKYPQM